MDKASPKLQALVYDILPWRKVPESDARSVGLALSAIFQLLRGEIEERVEGDKGRDRN